jgi:hypothetical protein
LLICTRKKYLITKRSFNTILFCEAAVAQWDGAEKIVQKHYISIIALHNIDP